MNLNEFERQHLLAKGVHRNSVKPYPYLLSKYVTHNTMPRVFENPYVFWVKQAFVLSFYWFFLMWLLVWERTLEPTTTQVIASLFVGTACATIDVYHIVSAQKLTGTRDWQQWREDNYPQS
ncbi:hypothetical protein A1QO_01730 [Vibrio genomosp. F10 str. ZF-129]|uniref:Uncharacterized protein n=1 Tax=Vibrio genomosp. F10 str. ZF-129 TaxID=1187848 RepID=A0A1E5BCV2_9VIBR|nr:DUF6404 family protein [Vibrio genomosp. F10]OEE32659.1 hypothetical protein A1QO_01730 [Vibrio genomosp. F10 str. ZF-129]